MLAKSVALPNVGPQSPTKNLKRTASAASLPTPPRTQRRRGRRWNKLSDNSSDEEVLPVLDKKPRLECVVEEEEDQTAFWLSKDEEPKVSAKPKLSSNSSSWSSDEEEDDDTVPPVLLRRKDATSGYASPPPSNRKLLLPPLLRDLNTKNNNTGIYIRTPPHSKISFPIRDSPNNPFLGSPPANKSQSNEPAIVAGDSDSTSSSDAGEDSDTNGDIGKNPTITYVHRGVRRAFPNPYHDPKTGRPRPPNPNSLLPPEHPDYEPDLRYVSRVLFPVEEVDGPSKKRRGSRRGKYAKVKKEQPKKKKKVTTDSSDDSDEGPKTPKGSEALLMAPGPPIRSRKGKIEDSW